MSSEFKNIFKHSFVYGVGSILTKLVGFVMIPVYCNTKFLKPEELGLMEILDNTINIISLIAGMGLCTAILRFYSEDKRRVARETLISTAVLVTALATGIAALLGIIFSTELSFLLMKTRGYGHPFTVMMFILFFSCLVELPKVVLRAKERSTTFILVCIGQLFLACALNIFFIVVLRRGIAGWLLGTLWTSVITCSYLVVTTLGDVRKIRFSFSLLKRMLPYSLPLIPSSLAMAWIHIGDRFILIRGEDGASDTGIYGLGYRFAMMIVFLIAQPFFLAWSVRMFDVFEGKDGPRAYARIFTYFVSVMFMAWLFLSVVVEDVISIMTDDVYHTAHLIVPLIALGYVLREFSDFFRGVLLIKRRTSFIGIWVAIVAVIAAVLYLVLIPKYRQLGAMWATFITFAVMAGGMFIVSQRVHKVPYEYKRLAVAAVVAAVMFFGLRAINMENPFLDIAVKGGLSLLYFPGLYLVGFFLPDEKRMIRDGIGRALVFAGIKKASRPP